MIGEVKNKTESDSSLVSVIVVTHNSMKYVLETLESVKEQTYQNIELIITDDASTDNTINICSAWLDNNKTRFAGTKLIVSDKNTGISANCNRGITAAKGKWIKFIAGDDFLSTDILSKQIEYINSEKEIKFLWTNVAVFYDKPGGRQISVPSGVSDLRINSNGITAEEQFQITLRGNPVFTPGILIQKELFNIVGLYDESYKMFEDLPFIHKVLLNGFKLHYLDIAGAYHRKHDGSVQVARRGYLRNQHKLDVYRYQIEILQYYNNAVERWLRKIESQYNLFYVSKISNKKNIINKLFLYLPSVILRKIINLFVNQYQ